MRLISKQAYVTLQCLHVATHARIKMWFGLWFVPGCESTLDTLHRMVARGNFHKPNAVIVHLRKVTICDISQAALLQLLRNCTYLLSSQQTIHENVLTGAASGLDSGRGHSCGL